MLAGFAIWTVVASLVTAILYGWDKRAAVNGRDRIAESTLLVGSLLGGWPGGLAASRFFRHKTSKLSYRIKFGVCVVVNLAVTTAAFILLR